MAWGLPGNMSKPASSCCAPVCVGQGDNGSMAVRFRESYLAVSQCQPRPKVPIPKVTASRARKPAPPASRLLYSKPPLESLTKVILPAKAKPPEGTPQGTVNRGFAAVYFGANSAASALNLPRDRDVPKNHPHLIKAKSLSHLNLTAPCTCSLFFVDVSRKISYILIS
jgi:hypothetical protein